MRIKKIITYEEIRKYFDLLSNCLKGLKGLICRFAATCVAGVERGGERRGKGEEIGERVKQTPPPPVSFPFLAFFFASPPLPSHFFVLAMQSSL